MEEKTSKNTSFLKRLKQNDFIKNAGRYTLLLPSLVFMVIFAYLPMVGIIIAFQDYDPIAGFFGSTFTGFENFKFLEILVDLLHSKSIECIASNHHKLFFEQSE